MLSNQDLKKFILFNPIYYIKSEQKSIKYTIKFIINNRYFVYPSGYLHSLISIFGIYIHISLYNELKIIIKTDWDRNNYFFLNKNEEHLALTNDEIIDKIIR